ncbi:peritrophin-44-like isoform X2 [Panulirus ornatus]|uniref:peritrophin-44-like isoform X2 n=1 Tax=Panulirus ornatus TaxID=150431 RepID=UPI003A886C2A
MNNRCLLLLLLLVALMAVGVAGVAREGCAGPDCSGAAAGTGVADPTDCSQYYLCMGDGTNFVGPFPCPDGEVFDDTEKKCMDGGTCTPACVPQECHLACDGYPSSVADPKDCGKFQVCVAEDTTLSMTCPSDKPYFDGGNLTCGTDLSKCCDNLCVPYCFTAGTNIPDPLDCTSYYMCAADNSPPTDDIHMSCPVGQNFNILTGMCAKGAPCTILCDEGGVDTTLIATGITPTSGCMASLTCTELGYFPKCTTCQQEYFYCTAVGQPAASEKCSGTLVFNPDPGYPYCVLPSNCPYHPPI